MASWQDIPLFYGSSDAKNAVKAMLTNAADSTQRIAMFSDSRGRVPRGQGLDFVPLLNYKLTSQLAGGTVGETPITFVANYLDPAMWLVGCSLSGDLPTSNDTPVNRSFILPGMGRGESKTGVLTQITSNNGILNALLHDAININDAAGVPTNRDYIGADQGLIFDFFGYQQSGAPDIVATYLRQATPGSFTVTEQSSESLSGLDGTGGFVKISTSTLTNADFENSPYSAIAINIAGSETNAIMLGGRWRRASDPGGICVTSFSLGGLAAADWTDDHADAGQMMSTLGPWAATLIHVGANDIFFSGKTAAQWRADVEDHIAQVRSASWLNDPTHLVLVSTDSPSESGTTSQDTQHDLFGSEAKAIADADEYVGVINTRLGCENLGFTRATSATYLSDGVHPNADGADIVAQAMVASLETQMSSASGGGGGFGSILGNALISPTTLAGFDGAVKSIEGGSLLGYYNMAEDAATAKNNPGLQDTSGGNNTATDDNVTNPSWDLWFTFQVEGPGEIDNVIDVIASGRPGWANKTAIAALPAQWTMMAIFKQDGNGGPCAFTDASAGSFRGVFPWVRTNGVQLYSTNDAGSTSIIADSANIYTDSEWHMIVCTYDGTNPKIYVDNVDITANPTSLSGTFSTDRLCIGNAGRDAAPSTLSEIESLGPVAFWSTAIIAAQVEALWDASGLG